MKERFAASGIHQEAKQLFTCPGDGGQPAPNDFPRLPNSQFHQKLNISLIQLKNPKQPGDQETTHRVHLLGAPPFG